MLSNINTSEIKSWGNSLGIRIPKKIANSLNLEDGSSIKLSVKGNKIIIESSDNKFKKISKDMDLLKLTSKINKKNQHNSRDFVDKPAGKEVW